MTSEQHDHQNDCLMCAVRALTEGDPAAVWRPEEEGSEISGVMLRRGMVFNGINTNAFIDLWTGGTGRVRAKAYGEQFTHALDQAAPTVGDRVTIRYNGLKHFDTRSRRGQLTYRAFTVTVQRGH